MFLRCLVDSGGRGLFSALLFFAAAVLLIPSTILAQGNKYQYSYKGQSVGMQPSDSLVVVQRTRMTRGVDVLDNFSNFELTLDSLTEKIPERGKGISVLRLARSDRTVRAASQLREQLKQRAEQDSYIYQPVFEQGQAIFIPTAEVLVGFKNPTSREQAVAYFTNSGQDLGIVDIKVGGENLFVLTINDPGDGRCYEVSRRVGEMYGIDYAEPNHLIIFLNEENSNSMLIDDTFLEIGDDMIGGAKARNIKAPSVSQNLSADLAQNWTVITAVNGEEASFPEGGWQVVKKNDAAQVFWGRTKFRTHSGSYALYCAAGGGGGVQAPGPAPVNIGTALLSPQMDLSSFEEAYVEVWFYAKNEFIRDKKGNIVSGDFASLFITDGEQKALLPLYVKHKEDATEDPTTQKGWRKLLSRIPPSFRTKPVQLRFIYVSNNTQQREGVYLDDIRVIASTQVAVESLGNDPYGGRQYELRNTGQIAGQGNEKNDMNVVDAWRDVEVSPEVVVAVIDDGVDLNHPDLNLITGYNADGSVGGGPVSPKSNHGTSVAGDIGAIGRNGIGVLGTAPNVKIMPISNSYSTVLGYANGIDIAVKKGAHILNNSWGFNGVFHRSIELAVLRAIKAGRIVLFAAGNGPDRKPYDYNVYFPGNMTGSTDLITVGASSLTDEHKSASSSDGQFTWGSSYIGDGPDICAPGPWSYTTDRVGKLGYNNGSTGIHPDYNHSFGGTSSATPKVAGVVALMLSANMNLTPRQVKHILIDSADDIDEPGFDDKTGGGRVNALRAVQMARALKEKDTRIPDRKKEKPRDFPDLPSTEDDNGFKKVLDW